MSYIVITGSLSDGFEFTGPFDDSDAAMQFVADTSSESGWVMRLLPPKQPVRKSRIVTAKRPGRRHGDER